MTEHELWDADRISKFLGCSKRYFLESVAIVAGFPQAIRFPVAGGRRSHPRWKAIEIVRYIEKHQEKRAA